MRTATFSLALTSPRTSMSPSALLPMPPRPSLLRSPRRSSRTRQASTRATRPWPSAPSKSCAASCPSPAALWTGRSPPPTASARTLPRKQPCASEKERARPLHAAPSTAALRQ
eukprot:Amastigsp_a174385_2496.p5 type:complete len:113 gc:universal Amastigsp_a174385_2496:616-954(+)